MIRENTKTTTTLSGTREREQGKEHAKTYIAWFETGLIVLGLLGIFFLLDHAMWWPDGTMRFDSLTKLFLQGQLSDTKYSIIGPLFSFPLWTMDTINHTFWWTTRYNVFVFAAGLFAVYWMLKDRVADHLLRRFFLLLIVASMYSHHLLFYYGEVFTSIFVAVGSVAIVAGPAIAGWCAIILGVANTPAACIGLILLDVRHILTSKRVRYALPIVATIGLILLESWIRRGSPFMSGYDSDHGSRTIMPYSGRPGFSNPIFFGCISLLFSFGKGIFFFAPGLLLPIRRTLLEVKNEMKVDLYAIYTLWMAFLIGLILIYSCWWSWHGGWFWGPRFLLFASIPASFALAVRLQWHNTSLKTNLMTIVVFGLSLWVGIDGAIYGDNALAPICIGSYWEVPQCYYTPEFSALWYPFVVHQSINYGQLLYLCYSLIVGIYLLVPLLITTGRQLSPVVRKVSQTRLHFRI